MIELIPLWRWLFIFLFAGMVGGLAAGFLWNWKPDSAFGDAFMLVFLAVAGPLLWLRKDIYAAYKGDGLAVERITGQRFSLFRKVVGRNG